MHGLFHLMANFFQPLTLMQVVEVFPLAGGKLGQGQSSLCCLSSFLPFTAACFIIVATNEDGSLRESVSHKIGHDRQVIG